MDAIKDDVIRRLARAVCQSQEFNAWLLEQDVSCAALYGVDGNLKSKVEKIYVEDKDDIELALAFIASRAG